MDEYYTHKCEKMKKSLEIMDGSYTNFLLKLESDSCNYKLRLIDMSLEYGLDLKTALIAKRRIMQKSVDEMTKIINKELGEMELKE